MCQASWYVAIYFVLYLKEETDIRFNILHFKLMKKKVLRLQSDSIMCILKGLKCQHEFSLDFRAQELKVISMNESTFLSC